jgi:enoyl-CoA hydratase
LPITVHATPLPATAENPDPGQIVEVVADYPPVNALPVAGWRGLAEALRAAGADPRTRAIVLRAEGRGFNAGVDIKELQGAADHGPLVAVNRACFDAFAAVYEAPVPVIAAVAGFCLGGGIGLVGNADILLASDDATFGLPEVERGALGAATHLARLVPPGKLRVMLYTGVRATAAELQAWGSVHAVVPRDRLRDEAMAMARLIASRDPVVMRAAKEAATHIDPVDPRASYRVEQGFTFELNLLGAGHRNRAAFLATKGKAT